MSMRRLAPPALVVALAWLARAEALADTDQAEALRSYERAAASGRQSGAWLFLTMIVFKLAAMLSAGGIAVAPNFTSCSTTIQPE